MPVLKEMLKKRKKKVGNDTDKKAETIDQDIKFVREKEKLAAKEMKKETTDVGRGMARLKAMFEAEKRRRERLNKTDK